MRYVNIADYTRMREGESRRHRRDHRQRVPKRRIELDNRLFDIEEQRRFDYIYEMTRRDDAPTDLRERCDSMVGSYVRFSRHASLLLEILTNSDSCSVARCYKERLDGSCEILCRELNCKMNCMIKILVGEFHRYASLHAEFFNLIVDRNVKRVSTHRLKNALTHIVNYSPSIALAQLREIRFQERVRRQ